MIARPYAQKVHGRRDSASEQPMGTHPMPLHMMTRGFACPNLRDGTYSGLIRTKYLSPYLCAFNVSQFVVIPGMSFHLQNLNCD